VEGMLVNMKDVACVILPTYNEAQNVGKIIPLIFKQQDLINTHILHVLVVDDNSPDGTQSVVRQLMAQFPHLHLITGDKKGLGAAYRRGFAHSIEKLSPELLFEMDADGQHDPCMIPLFIHLCNFGFSLIIGSRFAPGGSTPDFSLWRKSISKIGNWMIRYLGGVPRIQDCTSGFRCIKADLITKCNFGFLSTRGYSFQSSLLCELMRNGAKVIEVPIIFPDRRHGQSKLALKDQIEFLFNIGKIRFNRSKDFIKFCIIGIIGVVVNFGLYLFLTRSAGVIYEIAAPISIEISIVLNYLLKQIFASDNRLNMIFNTEKLWEFHKVAGIAGISSYLIFLFFIHALDLYDLFAILLGIGIGIIINYTINSFRSWN
jgi:dolichol-phosphate mannosyltransferase